MNDKRGPIVLCFGVLDEADIIDHFVEYHLGLGVDALVGTDLGSTDGTLEILEKYERQGILHLTRFESPNMGDEEDGTAWVNTAQAIFGARWCLFADPDEFWVLPNNDVAAYLSSTPATIITIPRYNMLPERDAGGGIKPFNRFSLLARRPLEFYYDIKLREDLERLDTLFWGYPPEILRAVAPKVAAHADVIKGMVPGCHNVIPHDWTVARQNENDAYIAHLPIRSRGQFQKKARLIYKCIERCPPSFPGVHVGAHWVRLNALFSYNLVDREFDRQLLSDGEIEDYLEAGVLARDETLSCRFRALARPIGRAGKN